MLGDLGSRAISFLNQSINFAKAVPLFSIKYMYFPIDIPSHQVGRHLWFNAPLR